MDDREQSAIGTAAPRHESTGADRETEDRLPPLAVIEQMPLAEVRRYLEQLAEDRLEAGIGAEATVRYHALCRRENELLHGQREEVL